MKNSGFGTCCAYKSINNGQHLPDATQAELEACASSDRVKVIVRLMSPRERGLLRGDISAFSSHLMRNLSRVIHISASRSR